MGGSTGSPGQRGPLGGERWQPLGAALQASTESDTTATSVKIAARGGEVFVAWVESLAGARRLHVRHWDGAQWLALNPSASEGVDGSVIDLGVDGQGRPHVAWAYQDPFSDRYFIHVARWEGASWTQLGDAQRDDPSSNAVALSPTLTFDASDAPILAWQESSRIRLRRWSGGGWQSFGGGTVSSAADGPSAFDPQLATDSRGRILLGFRESGP